MIRNDRLAKIRVKASNQVLEVLPSVARAMIAGGTAEEFVEQPKKRSRRPETAVATGAAEKAVSLSK